MFGPKACYEYMLEYCWRHYASQSDDARSYWTVLNDSVLVNPTSGDGTRVFGRRDTGGADWLFRSWIGVFATLCGDTACLLGSRGGGGAARDTDIVALNWSST